MTTTFKPLHDIVLVKRNPAEDVTKGGIVMPNANKRTATTGVVLAVGKGKHCEQTGVFVETTVKEGDVVMFSDKSGFPVKIKDLDDKDDLVVMREVEIIGIVN